MRVLISIAAVVVLWTACVGAGAVGKVTVDPNAGQTVAQRENDGAGSSSQDTDPRLDRKITYSARRKLVSEIVDDLAKLADAKMYAGRDAGDWHTRDLRMNVIVKDATVGDVMASIARVMQFRWNRSSSGEKWVYRLVDPNATSDESVEVIQARAQAERRQRFFAGLMSLARASSAEIDRLRTSNPELYALAKTPYGVPLAKFLADTPVASMALVQGRKATLRGNDLPLSAMQTLMPAIQGGTATEARPDGKNPAAMPAIPASGSALSVEINPNAPEKGVSQNLGEMTLAYGGRTVPITFADPERVKEKLAASTPAVEQSHAGSLIMLTAPTDPEVEHPDEPDLHKRTKLAIKDARAPLDAVLAALAEASGFAVVSDCYDAPSKQIDVPQGEIELKDCLEKITAASGQNWEKKGQALELRNRKWRIHRYLLISQATLRNWRKTLERDGYLPFAELARIVELFPDQISVYITSENGLPGVADAVSAGRAPLCWFAELDESGQANALRSSGVAMTVDAIGKAPWVKSAVLAAKPHLLDDSKTELRFAVCRETGADKVYYAIRVLSGGREQAVIGRFACPRAEPPHNTQ